MVRAHPQIAVSVDRGWFPRVLGLLVALLVAKPCLAIPSAAWSGEPVPLERVLENVSRYVKQKPTDAQGQYTLGRLHTLAFARGMGNVPMNVKDLRTGEPLSLPGFPGRETLRQARTEVGDRLDVPARGHLVQSVRHYQLATRLDPKVSLYWLGLGWMLEQGAPFAAQVDEALFEIPRRSSPAFWRERALAAYRRGYALDIAEDLKAEGLNGMSPDGCVSFEAAEGIVRLLGRRPLRGGEKKELAEVQRSLKLLGEKPRWMSPIIFPLHRPAALDELLASDRVVTFDLAGSGQRHRWPWVGPDTGILVWDPARTGWITSGRQLFGWVTWAGFWKDGYQPLAALDDDQDGWLAGTELDGLAVWCDANGDGVSDSGEVRPLVAVGIARVAVRSGGRLRGMPYNAKGLQRRDGSFLPTYDWTPSEVVEPRHDVPKTRPSPQGGEG